MTDVVACAVVPLLPCAAAEATIDFLTSLGFEVTHHQSEPYLSLAVRLGDAELHYVDVPEGLQFARESGGCMVMADAIDEYHHAFTEGMRRRYGKVLATGQPRVSRLRPGQTRFQVIDPTGNYILFIRRDEPTHLDYGGAPSLHGLAREVDNARILRDFKMDDHAAAAALDAGLSRFGGTADTRVMAEALAVRAELAVALGERDRAVQLTRQIEELDLTETDRVALRGQLDSAAALVRWLDG